MKGFIGFYDYTVILTYLSLLSAVIGMDFAYRGNFNAAIFCLFLCGFCDAFDGTVARTKKNRTDDEKAFGICQGFYGVKVGKRTVSGAV